MNNSEYPKMYLYRRIVQAKLFIDNNYEKNLDLNNIAGSAYFSKFHFIRLFKAAFKKTPHQYLMHVRIEKAKEFLKQTSSVIDVCYSVGFESPGSFTELFKRQTGITPSMFRQQHIQKQNEIFRFPLKFIPHCFTGSV